MTPIPNNNSRTSAVFRAFMARKARQFLSFPLCLAWLFASTANVTQAQIPDPPVIGAAFVGDSQVFVSFTAPAVGGSSPISAYTATCNPTAGVGALAASGVTAPIAVSGLTNGTPYVCAVTATNAAGISAPSATVSVTPLLGAPLALIGIKSRKIHGATGTFDIPIDSAALIGGLVSVEPRRIGAAHNVVFQFNATITSSGSVAAIDESGIAVTAVPAQIGNEIIVALPGLADNKRVAVSLTNVNGLGAAGSASAAVGFLVGDTNNFRAVNPHHIAGIKTRSGQTTTAANFRFDLNASGVINAVDIATVKARSGSSLRSVIPPGSVVASVEIEQKGLMLTQMGASKQLSATARDALGNILNVPLTWTSSRPAVMAVNGSGVVTATSNAGASQIVVQAGGVTSAPLLALVTQPASGAVLLTDSQIVGEPTETTPGAAASFTNTYQVRLSGVPAPAVGDLLINTESKVVAGRVVAVDAGSNPILVTLRLVPLRELLPTLQLNETIDLANAPVVLNADVAADYNMTRDGNTFTFTPKSGVGMGSSGMTSSAKSAALSSIGQKSSAIAGRQMAGPTGTRALPPFSSCETSITGGGGEGAPLPIALSAPPLFSVTVNPTIDVDFDLFTVTGVKRLVVNAEPVIKFEGGINIAVAFEGKIECKMEVFAYAPPIGGPLALIIAGVVPVGIGFEAGGKLTVATMGIGTKVEVKAKTKDGISCPGGNLPCSFESTMDNLSATVTPTLDTPSIGDIRLEPSLSAFGYIEAAIGNVFLKSLRFDFIKAKAGAKLAGSFALKESQLADPAYASDYKLSLEASAGAGGNLGDVLSLLGLSSVSALELVISTDIAKSPSGLASGAVTADKGSFVTGDVVNFTVKLDPATVNFFPGLGPYNVKKLQLMRKMGGTISMVGSVDAVAGQANFNFAFTAPDSGTAEQFSAFVVTTLLPLDLLALEVGTGTVNVTPVATKRVAAGSDFSCALTSAGGAKCWGNNANGRLGDGTNVSSFRPVNVVGLSSGVVDISAGSSHACAVTATGGVKCWGRNLDGRLGNGTRTNSSVPVDVVGLSSDIAVVSAGRDHTCALSKSGSVKCWGYNAVGQLGNGSTADSTVPVDVEGLSSGVIAIEGATADHTCAVTAAGIVKCWGWNEDRQLGNGSAVNSAVPVDAVLGPVDAVAVSGGSLHSCAVTRAGAVACWGYDGFGRLGDGSITGSAVGISSGVSHTCIVTVDGAAKCWGRNLNGELGRGTFDANDVGTPVPATVVGLSGGVLGVSAGSFHTCVMTTAGEVVCWGNNFAGQLGDGTATRSSVPVVVGSF